MASLTLTADDTVENVTDLVDCLMYTLKMPWHAVVSSGFASAAVSAAMRRFRLVLVFWSDTC